MTKDEGTKDTRVAIQTEAKITKTERLLRRRRADTLRRRRTSIWQQTDTYRTFTSKLAVPSCEFDLEILTALLSTQRTYQKYVGENEPDKVYIFDVVESRREHFNLEKRYGIFMNKFNFRPTTINIEARVNFNDIVSAYEKFAMKDFDKVKPIEAMTSSDRKKLSIQFRKKLFKIMFYKIPEDEQEVNIYFHFEKEKKRILLENITYETNWLEVMTWWKLHNFLVTQCKKLHKYLRERKEEQNDQNISKLQTEISNLLRDLNLVDLPAVISAIKVYDKVSEDKPDIESWSIEQESAFKGFDRNFFQNMSQDSLFRYFLKECCDCSLNSFLSIVKHIAEYGKISIQSLESIVKFHVDNFLCQTITYLDEVVDERCVSQFIQATNKKIENFLKEMIAKKHKKYYEFESIVEQCYTILFLQMKLTARTFQHLFFDSNTIISSDMITINLISTVSNGIYFAKKALQNDFLSYDLLKKINEEENLRQNINLDIQRSLKFAYIITSCYKIFRGYAAMFFLPTSYIQHDFDTFLNRVKRDLNIRPYTELSPMDFNLKIRVFQDKMLRELTASFDSIDRTVYNAKLLLHKAKQIK